MEDYEIPTGYKGAVTQKYGEKVWKMLDEDSDLSPKDLEDIAEPGAYALQRVLRGLDDLGIAEESEEKGTFRRNGLSEEESIERLRRLD